LTDHYLSSGFVRNSGEFVTITLEGSNMVPVRCLLLLWVLS
jgi:hypothetical protein